MLGPDLCAELPRETVRLQLTADLSSLPRTPPTLCWPPGSSQFSHQSQDVCQLKTRLLWVAGCEATYHGDQHMLLSQQPQSSMMQALAKRVSPGFRSSKALPSCRPVSRYMASGPQGIWSVTSAMYSAPLYSELASMAE